MNLYIKATIITVISGLLIGALFYFWKVEAVTGDAVARIGHLELLEKDSMLDFEIASLRGEPIQLSQFKGHVVILNFWASWCAPCVEEIPSLIDLIKTMNGEVKLIAISLDNDKEEMLTFLKSFPEIEREHIYLAWDGAKETQKLYQVQGLPESFIVGKDFRLARKIVGDIKWNTEEAIAFMRNLVNQRVQ